MFRLVRLTSDHHKIPLLISLGRDRCGWWGGGRLCLGAWGGRLDEVRELDFGAKEGPVVVLLKGSGTAIDHLENGLEARLMGQDAVRNGGDVLPVLIPG